MRSIHERFSATSRAGRAANAEPGEKGSGAVCQVIKGFLKQVQKLLRLRSRHGPVKVIKGDIHPVAKSQE